MVISSGGSERLLVGLVPFSWSRFAAHDEQTLQMQSSTTMRISVIFVLIYFLVLVFFFVSRVFFSFSFVLVFIIFFVFVIVLFFCGYFLVLLSF